jgi:putative peptide maturation dehydrogenase
MTEMSLRVRRRHVLFLQIGDRVELDITKFLMGSIAYKHQTQCMLLCPIRGDVLPINVAEFELIMKIPEHKWVSLSEIGGLSDDAVMNVRDLAQRGVLLSDPAPQTLADLVPGEETLQRTQWEEIAAVYHAHTQWRGKALERTRPPLGEDDKEMAFDHLRRIRGDAPPHFVRRPDAQARMALCVPLLDDPFFDTLISRRTSRAYNFNQTLSRSALETMLYVVFGTQGTKNVAESLTLMKRTSPSGGALHPIEAYVLAIRVAGVPTGLYHYESETHALAQLELMDIDGARALTYEFTAGQTHFSEAHALVIHVARLHRSFWKYSHHQKAYKSVLMDSGHLSQTFYLTAAYLKLGAFYTAAINDFDIGRRLRLDPLREAAIAINGCGIPDDTRQQLTFVTDPYQPSAND